MNLQTLIVICAGLMFLSLQTYAQEEKAERRAKPILSNSVYRPINRAQEAIQNEIYDEALLVLSELLARGDKLDGYDRAKTLQIQAIVYIQQQDYLNAVNASQKAIDVNALDVVEQREMRYNLVSMLFLLEKYEQALEQLEIWIAETPEMNAQENFTAAQLYLTVDELQEAQHYAESGMDLHKKDDQSEPKENWYRLLLAIYGRQENYQAAAKVVEQLIAYWPSKLEYYNQLSGLYQQLERQKEAWAVVDIAYHNGLLEKQDDFRRLLQMHRFFAYPYRGAEIFEVVMSKSKFDQIEKDWEDLANAWLQARQWNRAELALTEAAKLSDSGQHWFRLCQTAFQDERWQHTLSYCQSALDKGGLKEKKGSAWQLMAMVHFSLDEYDNAANYFDYCKKEEETARDCGTWLSHVSNHVATLEQQRQFAEQRQLEAKNRRENRDEIINQALLMGQ